jgi:hypothetical protein
VILKRSRELVTALAVVALISQCGSLDRRNPADPVVGSTEQPSPALSLLVPVPKALVSVIDSMIAILEGPDMTTIEKVVGHSPNGPGLLTIGAIPPGSDRTLTIRGFDHQGQLIMEGVKSNITIAEGDTARITINMTLAEGFSQDDEVPEDPEDPDDPDAVTSTGETAGKQTAGGGEGG